jgi:hypothetical protein
MFLKLVLSVGLLTAVGMAPSFAQTTSDTRSPALGDPGAKPPAKSIIRKPRFHHIAKPAPASDGVGNAPDRAAAGGGGR